MARNDDVEVSNTWVQLTNANASAITLQNKGGQFVLVKGTTDTTPPASDAGAVRYNPGQGEANLALSDMFPGIAAVRVWARCDGNSTVMVSHADA